VAVPPREHDITELLLAWRQGDDGALQRLVPLVYQELRRLAHAQMRRESAGQVLQTTALVHPNIDVCSTPKALSRTSASCVREAASQARAVAAVMLSAVGRARSVDDSR
jgi:hypothetical protein